MQEAVSPEGNNALLSLVNTQQPKITPDIYLLIYDAYVVNETMLSYGIDNQAQEQYLEELGFTIYPHTYTIGNHTIGTMSRVLNVFTRLLWKYAKRGFWRRDSSKLIKRIWL